MPTVLRSLAALPGLVLIVLLVAACGTATAVPAAARPAPLGLGFDSPEAAASASLPATAAPAPAALSCTSSGAASGFPDPWNLSAPPLLSIAAKGDALTFTFRQGTPSFEVTPQSSARFLGDPKGEPIDLSGSAGVRIVLRGFRGDMQNYSGPSPISSNGSLLRQVARTGDFEGVFGWGAGLSQPGCAHATASGSTLTFQFVPTSREASATAARTGAAPVAAATSTLTCTPSGAASASFQAAPIVSAAVAGDTFTLTFAHGTPAFEVLPQSSAEFTKDPSGLPVRLAGSAGVRIVLRGFRGDVSNYSGPTPIRSSGPVLLEVAEIGDFEGVVSWGAGLSQPGCANVTASGSTLTFRFLAVNGKG